MAESEEARNKAPILKVFDTRCSTSATARLRWTTNGENERAQTAKGEGALHSELVDDLHEVIHFSVHGRFAAFQMLLHGDAGKIGQDHLRK
jgi:hypothetical protein